MSLSQNTKTLQSLLTHYAKNNSMKRVQTNFPKSELIKFTGAREAGGVVMYPHMWRDGDEWRVTTFELIPK